MKFALATFVVLSISVASAYFGFRDAITELQVGAFLWLGAGCLLLRLTMMDVFDDYPHSVDGHE